MRNQQFDFSVNALQALLWEYDDAPALTSLMQGKQSWYDTNQSAFWNDWVVNVFDLRTANDFGCAVWAVILRIPLTVVVPAVTKATFGFSPFYSNFDRSNFSTKGQATLPLTLDQKRLVLQLRYFQLITRGTIPAINAFFKRTFANLGPVYVQDNLNMSLTYHFGFVVPSSLQFILQFYDLLPRPAGVSVSYTSL